MPTFEIEQYELHTMKHRVEAKDEALLWSVGQSVWRGLGRLGHWLVRSNEDERTGGWLQADIGNGWSNPSGDGEEMGATACSELNPHQLRTFRS